MTPCRHGPERGPESGKRERTDPSFIVHPGCPGSSSQGWSEDRHGHPGTPQSVLPACAAQLATFPARLRGRFKHPHFPDATRAVVLALGLASHVCDRNLTRGSHAAPPLTIDCSPTMTTYPRGPTPPAYPKHPHRMRDGYGMLRVGWWNGCSIDSFATAVNQSINCAIHKR